MNDKFRTLKAKLEAVHAEGRTVPCWTAADYRCGGCPALAECRAYAASEGLEDEIRTGLGVVLS